MPGLAGTRSAELVARPYRQLDRDVVSGVVAVVGAAALRNEPPRKMAGATLTAVSVRNVQRTSTPADGAVGVASGATQHAGGPASGV